MNRHKRVHENVIIIGDLSEPIGDRHACSETHRRPRHASSETNMPYQRPTKLIGDLSETDMLHWRPTCQIGDPSETHMPHQRPTCLWRPIENQHACGIQSEFKHILKYTYFYILFAYLYTCPSSMGHVGFRWFSD